MNNDKPAAKKTDDIISSLFESLDDDDDTDMGMMGMSLPSA